MSERTKEREREMTFTLPLCLTKVQVEGRWGETAVAAAADHWGKDLTSHVTVTHAASPVLLMCTLLCLTVSLSLSLSFYPHHISFLHGKKKKKKNDMQKNRSGNLLPDSSIQKMHA